MLPGSSRPVSAGTVAAAVWGLAEATVFFIVPDVLLTFLAQTSLRRVLAASLAAALGALAGGAVLYGFVLAAPETASAMLQAVPDVSPELVSRVAALLDGGLFTGLVAGAFSGAPYKLFAEEAAATGVPLSTFLLASLPARLLRFSLAGVASWLIFAKLLGGLSLRTRRWLLAGFWLLFYAAYYAGLGW